MPAVVLILNVACISHLLTSLVGPYRTSVNAGIYNTTLETINFGEKIK